MPPEMPDGGRTPENDPEHGKPLNKKVVKGGIGEVVRALRLGCLEYEPIVKILLKREWRDLRILKRLTVSTLGAYFGAEIDRVKRNAPSDFVDRCFQAVKSQATPEAGIEVFADPGKWKLPEADDRYEERDTALLYLGSAVAALKAQKKGLPEWLIVEAGGRKKSRNT